MKNIRDEIEAALDIKHAATATFNPPNQLTVSMGSSANHMNGMQYHILVEGILLESNDSDMCEAIGMTTDPKAFHLTQTTSQTTITIDNNKFYNVTALRVFVNGTIKTKNNTPFNGKVYETQVPNVHPTLHPPSNLKISYHHQSRQICVTALLVEHAWKYYFEFIDENNKCLEKCTYNPPPQTTEIHCNSSQLSVTSSSTSPFKVRGQALAKSESGITSSVFVYSNELNIVDPITNLTFTQLPKFGEHKQVISLKWTLPAITDKVQGLTCQAVAVDSKHKSKQVIRSVELVKVTNNKLPTTYSFEIENIVNGLLLETTELMIKVSVTSNSDQTIDSIFVGQSIALLQPPKNVTFNVSADNLNVYWTYVPVTCDYGIFIDDSNTKHVMYSKNFKVKKSTEEKVCVNIPLEDLKNISDLNEKYFINVASLPPNASADKTEVYSLIPSKAVDPLEVLQAPDAAKLVFSYNSAKDSISASFDSVTNAHKYLFYVLDTSNQALCSTIVHEPASDDSAVIGYIPVDKFIDLLDDENTSVRGLIKCLGEGTYLSSAFVITNTLTTLPQPSDLKYSYQTEKQCIKLTCSPVSNEDYIYKFGFHDPDATDSVSNITKVGKSCADDLLSISHFNASTLRQSNNKEWKCFTQSSLAGDSSSHLPSPHLFLKNSVFILDTPSIELFEFSTASNILTIKISTSSVNCSYIMDFTLYDSKQVKLTKKTFCPPPSDHNVIHFNITNISDDWSKIVSEVTSVSLNVAAVGSGYYITSKMSETKMLRIRQKRPFNLQCSYSSNDDKINLSCQVDTTVKEVTISLELPNNVDDHHLSLKYPVSVKDGKAVISIAGQEIRKNATKEWKAFAQSVETTSSWSSAQVMFPNNSIPILQEPVISSMHFDVSKTSLTVSFSEVKYATSYKVVVTCDAKHGSSSKTISTKSNAITINMSKVFPNWATLIDSVSEISATVQSVGCDLYMNSKISEPSIIQRIFPPSNIVLVDSNDAEINVTWEGLADRFNITIKGGDKPFNTSTSNTSISIRKILFMNPTSSVHTKLLNVSIVAITDNKLPSSPSIKSGLIKTQRIQKSRIFGNMDGQNFDDAASKADIVGIHTLVVYHDDYVDAIKVTYLLSNGSTYVVLHGDKSEHSQESVLSLDNENSDTITAVSGNFSPNGLCQLIIVTQKNDGFHKHHGPFGQSAYSEGASVIRFSSNVLSFRGRCNNARLSGIGFNFAYTASIVVSNSCLLNTQQRVLFDSNVMTHHPQITGIKSIQISATTNFIGYIKIVYYLDDGKTLVHAKHGSEIVDANYTHHILQFEEDERIIQICGRKLYDQNVTSVLIVSTLSLTCVKKNGEKKVYGPYGYISDNTGAHGLYTKLMTVTGNIMGFYGFSGWLLDSLGVYYSLQCSQLYGNASHNEPFDDEITSHIPRICGIKSLEICYNDTGVTSLQAMYWLSNGSSWQASLHGVKGQLSKKIEFEQNEQIVQMEIGLSPLETVPPATEVHFASLEIKTDNGSIHGPFGSTMPQEFTILNERVIGFFGQSGPTMLEGLGVYYIAN